jgi:hypothetical protein
MVGGFLKSCVEECISFFLTLEDSELEDCGEYNESCRICNPQ